ncbi:MAG: AmmeMemoRadiSam system radical SAM enzyme [Candidatus Sumerlaeia bacterium]
MQAILWERIDDESKKVLCNLCNHYCRIAPGKYGLCRARKNEDGELTTEVYGKLISMNADPIEKKPLYHFLPNSYSLSVATAGCNFRCDFCQNCEISQALFAGHEIPYRFTAPEDIVAAAKREACASISYTYTEPTIFFEYALDTAKQAVEAGIANCFVSNGFMTVKAVETIAPYLQAINVDLKCFSEETYRKVIGGRLEPVLETIRALYAAGIWMELTTLIVPDMNDTEEEIREIARFIADLDPQIPWHVSRFFPRYQRNHGHATQPMIIQKALEIGQAQGLKHIYCGNIMLDGQDGTHCPNCGALVVRRSGYQVQNHLGPEGACPECQTTCAGVWENPVKV